MPPPPLGDDVAAPIPLPPYHMGTWARRSDTGHSSVVGGRNTSQHSGVDLIDFSQARDPFTRRRRLLALAALALLAIEINDAASYAALQQATQHSNPDVRGIAVGYLGRTYLDTERPFPPDVQHLLHTIATTDSAFPPRYKARMNLIAAGIPLPLDYPDGVFLFKVKFLPVKTIYRTIAVRSTQTLHDLHMSIQDAINWDDDHLYSFFLYGNRGDDPDACIVGPWEDEQESEIALYAHELQIGVPGFKLRHTFLYSIMAIATNLRLMSWALKNMANQVTTHGWWTARAKRPHSMTGTKTRVSGSTRKMTWKNDYHHASIYRRIAHLTRGVT